MSTLLLLLLSACLIGIVILIVVVSRKRILPDEQTAAVLRDQNIELAGENSALKERASLLVQQSEGIQGDLAQKEKAILELNGQLNRKNAEFEGLQARLAEQRSEIEKLQEKFRTEFRNLANEILEEKTKKFTEQNRIGLETLLKPLGEKIREFEKKVEDTYDKESKQRFSLEKEIRTLAELNQKISEDARNLTTALKSDSKKQGNWGELVLERVLESSGLVKGLEYTREFATKSNEGETYRPDVIVHLPEKKHIIIDAKVSLVAYNDFVNSGEGEEKEKFLKMHLLSVRNHVKLLGEKKYQNLEAFDTPDYVLLFLPIESAFSLALQSDPDLFNYAWDRNVVIVSPTTLLATLRTIASIWKHEKQTQNALEIARQGGDLYDKFVGFIEDLKDVGKKIEASHESYESAMGKLSEGKGNLVRRAQKLRELGAKTSKELPKSLLESDEEETDRP